jgi:hypothetical protein
MNTTEGKVKARTPNTTKDSLGSQPAYVLDPQHRPLPASPADEFLIAVDAKKVEMQKGVKSEVGMHKSR